MPEAYNSGVRVAYERSGPPEAETVVFVEGLGYGRWMWHWQRPALDSWETICWDNRGTGDSAEPAGTYTIAEMAGDLGAVLDDAGVESAHVVGASMGGMIAQQFALADERVQSVTLLCSSPGGPEAVPTPKETRERMFDVPETYDEREARRYKMRAAMSERFWRENDELIEQIIDWRLDSDASEQALAWQAAAVEAFDVHERLTEIRVPVLVLHGTTDRVVPVDNGELLAEGLPNAEFHRFEEAPHLFFIERPAAVNSSLTEFLTDV